MATLEEKAANPLPLQVDITFSRPTYRLGGTIVGTIRVHSTDVLLKSLQLSAVGLCRLDPRWHRSNRLADTNVLLEHGIPDDFVLPPHTLPFWTAGSAIELMHLPERTYGAWEEVRPTKPIRLLSTASKEERSYGKISVQPYHEESHMDPGQLLFTFRISLPPQSKEYPHSFQGTSCRYYYCILLRILTGNASHPEWLVRPVVVLPAHPNVMNHSSTGRLGTTSPPFQVMAHSTGLPTRISANELQPFEGQYTVVNGGGAEALYRNVRTNSAQSICVVDPTSQRPVTVLTILGSPSDLHPGARLSFQLDFSGRHSATQSPWIPCYQVSACLEGQEMVMGTASNEPPRLARRYNWSTAHETVDPETTECLSLSLLVPESVPCSVHTSHVELNVQCLLDIAVGTPHFKTGKIDYRNVHMELPCQIRPGRRDWECDDDDDVANSTSDLRHSLSKLYESVQMLEREQHLNRDSHSVGADDEDAPSVSGRVSEFVTADIQKDLKLLSFQMAKVCGLQPNPANR
jgi:hypothetical protein